MQKISIVIVNYKTADLTIECVNSVIATSSDQFEIELIIFDNDSRDGSYERLSSLFPSVRIVALKKNIGFAAANNRGAEMATGDYVLFLNPDTVVLPGALEALWAFAQRRPEAGAWGGRTLFGDGALNPTSVSSFVTLRSTLYRALGLAFLFEKSPIFNPEVYPGWQRDTERDVDILFFCFVLVRLEIWRKLGGFDERFFMFCEDDDICWRMRELGLSRLFTPDACIVHHGGASTPDRADRIAMVLAARLLWIKLHWRPLPAMAARLTIQAGIFGRMLFDRITKWRRHKTGTWETVWANRNAWARAPKL
ncbi:glycosyltransferase family 2 protein [Microvirga terricola]|uniref:Glycosyltransferase family 2 protein n=1 Tax=Microvirga terricola TaxID=2719797 RepID=A0ABX0V7A1_9HYPH|nr:glycosyltransferase family 2 protein [Microvirga terricola]NIX75689.1 glycosyltransferase family 2 protein [Microvirga terricola]